MQKDRPYKDLKYKVFVSTDMHTGNESKIT